MTGAAVRRRSAWPFHGTVDTDEQPDAQRLIRPLDGVERREAVALADSTVRLAREVQRIEQGMGRGVRDGEDYCAVLLLAAKLATAIHEAPTWPCSPPRPRRS
ncbi:hypothetical protein ACWCQ1_46035 [Streptomyces sp. NPDC002144]